MANETQDPNKPAGAAASPQKRPNTIDLTATEIKSEPPVQPEPVVKPEPDSLTKEPLAATPPQPGAEFEPAQPKAGSSADQAVPPAGERPMPTERPARGLWPVIGIALAAAVIFFAIGIGAGQWLSGRAPQPAALAPHPVAAVVPPELQARIDKLERRLRRPGKIRNCRRAWRNSKRS